MVLELVRLFGTDGIRGIVNEWLTPPQVLRLASAIATYFSRGTKILVGRDSRAGNDFIINAVFSALLSAGIRVYYAGFVPTPALQYYIKHHDFDAGIMITASHNPPQYSGLKVIMSDGVEAPRDVEAAIEEIYETEKFRYISWHLLEGDVKKVNDVIDFYVNGIIDLLDVDAISKKRWKVVIDAANNVGGLATPKLLRKLNVKVLTLNADLSTIPYREPEPTLDTLREVAQVVRITKADLGVGHDGDADRAIFIDNKGRIIPGDRSALILCKHIVMNRKDNTPRRVVTAVSSSTVVEDELRKHKVEVIWTKVGSIIIARTMQKLGAMAGFEENGGFMYPPHQFVRDGAMTVGLMLEYLSKESVDLADIYDELPRRYLIKTKVPIESRDEGLKITEMLKQKFSNLRIIDVDGIKAIAEDYWFLVRPSGTEPVMRVFVEALSEEKAREILDHLLQIIKGG
jgi:phosphomannomutase/phosphoglucomutase